MTLLSRDSSSYTLKIFYLSSPQKFSSLPTLRLQTVPSSTSDNAITLNAIGRVLLDLVIISLTIIIICWLVCWSVGRLVWQSPWSVCHNFLLGKKVTLPCSYQGTCCYHTDLQWLGRAVQSTLGEPVFTSSPGCSARISDTWTTVCRTWFAVHGFPKTMRVFCIILSFNHHIALQEIYEKFWTLFILP